ncbi:MAG: four helix bundle protein [Gemmatimonadaceae bacterium]
MQDYHNLDVWARAHAQSLKVRKATRRFPRTGYASLKNQMTTAAESITFNIVEGCGASSQKDFARFLGISIKSAFELEYQLELARDYGVLKPEAHPALSNETIEIRKMLFGLQEKVLNSL